VFGNPFGKSSLKILKDYPTPQAILSENPDKLAQIIAKTARKGLTWGQNEYTGQNIHPVRKVGSNQSGQKFQ
jgi:hypothetical protein